MEEIKGKIQQFIKDTFLFEFNNEVTEKSDLFKSGVIDSHGYIQLVNYLETEFKINFTEEEILANVFVTFSSIMDYVSKKIQVNPSI